MPSMLRYRHLLTLAALSLLVTLSAMRSRSVLAEEGSKGSGKLLEDAELRKSPSDEAPVLGPLDAGREVEVLMVVGPWVRVRAEGVEEDGWLPRKVVQFEARVQDPDMMIVEAGEVSSAKGPSKGPPAGGGQEGTVEATDEEVCEGERCEEEIRRRQAEKAAAEESGEEAPSRSAPVQRVRVAVYTLKAQEGIEPRVADLVTDSLVAEVRKLQRVSTIGMSEIQDMLSHAERKRMLGCEADACLIEIGGALGVDLLVTGSLGVLGESHLINLRLIDVVEMKVHGRVNRRLKGGDGEEFLEAVGPAVEAMFPGYPLRPGFKRGVAPEMARKLNPPPLSPVFFWATTGVAAVVAAVGVGFGLASQSAQDDWTALGKRATEPGETMSADEFARIEDRLDSRTKWANTCFITAGALILVMGAEALFTDWYGDRELQARPVTAHLSPSGDGLTGGLALCW